MTRLLPALVLAVAFTFSVVDACPGSRRPTERSLRRACFANQKTLAGAIEMRCLDRNEKFLSSGPRRVTGELMDALVKEGYLQSPMVDPGFGPEEVGHYVAVPEGNGMFCLAHGAIDGEGTARVQLAKVGSSDSELLAAAWDRPPPVPKPPVWGPEMVFLSMFLLLNELICLGFRRAYRPQVLSGTKLFAWTGRILFLAALASGIAQVPTEDIALVGVAILELFVFVGVVSGAVRLAWAGLRCLAPVLVPAMKLKEAHR
ncbi:MAG: hypothetical protein HY303_17115 [Candidatus Wallbacteria bacterium]|nr:hypothetical protein [Candidatus Wallbacteria bacterium]